MHKVLHVPFAKVDDAQRMVYGYASTADRDSDGELITLDALKTALPAYMKFASVREMHDAKPIGKTKEASVDESGLYIGAKIVDNDAWKMVQEEVYSAFSVGGKVLERDTDDPTIIKSMNLLEISLVDLPANPQCRIDLFKVADTGAEDVEKKVDPKDPKDPDDDEDDDSADSQDDPDKEEDDAEDKKKSAREQEEDEMLYKRLVARFGQEKADELCKSEPEIAQTENAVEEDLTKSEPETEVEDVDDEFLATSLIEKLYAEFDVEKITALQATAKKEEVRSLLEFAKITKDIVAKAGSRHSRADMDSLQAIHDHASNMGATCSDNKAVKPGDLSKAYDKVRKLTSQLNESTETIDKLNKQVADKESFIEKLKKTPGNPEPITAPAELPDGLIAVSKGGGQTEDETHLNREEKAMKAWRQSREQAFAKKI